MLGSDTIAGPSEICVVADDTLSPRIAAADLLSQAEHDPAAQSILITADAELAQSIERSVGDLLETLPTQSTGRSVLEDAWRDCAGRPGPICRTGGSDRTGACRTCALRPEPLLAQIKHAGAIFVGAWAPEALGDYVTGSNHVLPTSGAARFLQGCRC